MICPACKESGRTSQVYLGMSTKTLLGGPAPYFDEEGNYHFHDPNTSTTECTCSNGHKFTIKAKGSCSCGWSGGETKIIIR